LPLVGANGWDPSSFTVLAQNYVRMKRSYGGKIVPGAMDTAAAKHLVQTYGGLAPQVALIAQVCLFYACPYIRLHPTLAGFMNRKKCAIRTFGATIKMHRSRHAGNLTNPLFVDWLRVCVCVACSESEWQVRCQKMNNF
jgi:hypothetical protein